MYIASVTTSQDISSHDNMHETESTDDMFDKSGDQGKSIQYPVREFQISDPNESFLKSLNAKQGLIDAMPGLWLMMGTSLLLVFSLFLMRQASALQKWVFLEDEHAPKHTDGILLACLTSAAILFFGTMYVLLVMVYDPDLQAEPNVVDLVDIVLRNPKMFAPILAVSSIAPILVSGYKFILVTMSARASSDNESSRKIAPRAIAGVICAFLNLAGSIATLIGFYETH